MKNAYWQLLTPEERGLQPDISGNLDTAFPTINAEEPSLHWYRCTPIWNMPDREVIDDVVILVFSGEMVLTINEQEIRVLQGELIYLPESTVYRAHNANNQALDTLVIHLKVRIFGNIPLSELIKVEGVIPMKGLIEQLSLECWKHFQHKSLQSQELCGALVLLWKSIHSRYRTLGRLHFYHEKLRSLKFFLPALKLIKENLEHPNSIKELSNACSLSESHFRRTFRASFGMSPVQYRQLIRLGEATRLLERTNMTIENISTIVGYKEVSYFSRMFRLNKGISPGTYRKYWNHNEQHDPTHTQKRVKKQVLS